MENQESRFQEAIRLIDEENARDPNQEMVDGVPKPRERAYSERLTEWVKKLTPAPSEELLLAARGQHIARWSIPRSSYEMNRKGYLLWRQELKKFHAEKVASILNQVGYDNSFIERVKNLVLKKNFPRDPEAVILEDALNLMFFQYQFSDLAKKTEPDKMVEVLQKAWKKISSQGRSLALSLPFNDSEKQLIQRALGT